MLGFAVALLLAPPQLAAPPFRQTWSLHSSSISTRFGLLGNVYVFKDEDAIRAIDLATGRTVWTRPWSKDEVPVACPSDPGTLYVGEFSPFPGTKPKRPMKKGAIVQLDPASGKTLMYLPMDLLGGCTVANGRAYLVDPSSNLKALDLGSKQILWSTSLAHGTSVTSDPTITPDVVCIDVSGDPRKSGRVVAVDRTTGKFLWSHPSNSGRTGQPLVVGGTLIAEDDLSLVGLDARTGREKWKVDAEGSWSSAAIVDGKVVCCFSRTLFELDPQYGAVLWRYRLRSNKEWDLPIDVLRWKDQLLVSEEPIAALSLDGTEIWRSHGVEGHVLWTNGSTIVTDALSGILAYEHGERAPLPTTVAGKRARAIELCKRLSTLDESGKADLVSLGEPAFEPLLQATIALAAAFERDHAIGDDMVLDELPAMLSKVTTARNIPKLISAIRAHPVNHTIGRTLLPALLMAKSGNEKEDVTVCLWVVSKEHPSAWPGDESSMALSFMRVCTDPRAKKYVRNWDRKHPDPRRRSGSHR